MTENSDEKPEYDDINDNIHWESEEEARNYLENGFNPSVDEYPSLIGNGEYVSRFRATYGATKKEYLRFERILDEKRYPEIYPWKRWAKSKQGSYQIPNYDGIDESERPTHITKEKFIDLYSAVCFANSHGAILNAHITIPWGDLGFTDHADAAKKLQVGFIKPLQGWYEYNITNQKVGGESPHDLYWIYSHECSKTKGFHTHFLASIPSEKIAKFKRWVINRFTDLSKIKPACINNPSKAVVAPPSHLMRRQWIRLQYLCKGLDPSAVVEIKGKEQPVSLSDLIQFAYSNPGHISCQNRVGSSGNLWPSKRNQAKFISLMEKGIFDKRKLYPFKIPESWQNSQNKYPEVIRISDLISGDDLALFESFDDTPSMTEITLEDDSPSPNKKLPGGEKRPTNDKPIAPGNNFSPLTNKKGVQSKGRQFIDKYKDIFKENVQPGSINFVSGYLPTDKEEVKTEDRKSSDEFLAILKKNKEDEPPTH